MAQQNRAKAIRKTVKRYKKMNQGKKEKNYPCRAKTGKNTYCLNAAPKSEKYLCARHTDTTNVFMSFKEYDEKIQDLRRTQELARAAQQKERVAKGFASMSFASAQVGRNKQKETALESLPIDEQKKMRGLPIVIR